MSTPGSSKAAQAATAPKEIGIFGAIPAPDGGFPNNWLSCCGGSGWEFDERTGQYYLHTFARQQPDLNFRNPEVVEAMLEAMRFWLDKGVDGFRVDVITGMIKDEQLRDEPENSGWDGIDPYARLHHVYSTDLPEVHKIVQKKRALIDSYPERVLIGEIYALVNPELVKYYGANLDGAEEDPVRPGVRPPSRVPRLSVNAHRAGTRHPMITPTGPGSPPAPAGARDLWPV